MPFTSAGFRKTLAITSLFCVLSMSCNNKAEELPPNVPGEAATEQMPLKKLNADSTSDMPVVSAPDSAAAMPNGYKDQSEKPQPR